MPLFITTPAMYSTRYKSRTSVTFKSALLADKMFFFNMLMMTSRDNTILAHKYIPLLFLYLIVVARLREDYVTQ